MSVEELESQKKSNTESGYAWEIQDSSMSRVEGKIQLRKNSVHVQSCSELLVAYDDGCFKMLLNGSNDQIRLKRNLILGFLTNYLGLMYKY